MQGTLHVDGDRLVDGLGNTVVLHGADRSGTEYECLGGQIFDGPHDDASLDRMLDWNLRTVRVPLNEDCWLGINGAPAATSGLPYKQAIYDWVRQIEAKNMFAILDLHWAAPGTQLSNGQLPMADADHAVEFWKEVASQFAGDSDRVLFDLFNEPYITDWDCWANGGTCAGYQSAGMAQLLKAVRDAGAANVVLMGGLAYASQFDKWVEKVSAMGDPNIALSWHTYSDQSVQTECPTQYNGYSTSLSCDDAATTVAHYGVPSGYPIIVGEIGIGAYSDDLGPYSTTQAQQLAHWLDGMLTYFDQHGISYLGWDWNTEAPPLLIESFDGTPTPYFGTTFKAHQL